MTDDLDVVEVLEGFPAPPGMTPRSRLEAMRRLDERAMLAGVQRLTAAQAARRLNVDVRTVGRYRQRLREQAQGAGS